MCKEAECAPSLDPEARGGVGGNSFRENLSLSITGERGVYKR